MSKKAFLIMVMMICLLSFVVVAEEASQISYLTYEGVDANQIHGVGVEKTSDGYLLKWFRVGEPGEVIHTSAEVIFQPLIATQGNFTYVSFLKEVNGELALYLMKNTQGNWEMVNTGTPLQSTLTVIDQMELIATEQMVYLAYVQADQLHLVVYDQMTGGLAGRYQYPVPGGQITSLTLQEQGQDIILAYSQTEQGQQNLHLVQLGASGAIAEFHSVQGVLGYDLAVLDSRLYLAYEQPEKLGAKIYLQEAIQGNFQQIGVLTKQDSTATGVKLLTAGSELKVLYREQGVGQPFGLYLSRLSQGQLTPAEYLPQEYAELFLANLQENVQELDDSRILLTTSHWALGATNQPGYQLVDLNQALPNLVWREGRGRGKVNQLALGQLGLAQVRNVNLLNPMGMATDSTGNLLIADQGGQVRKINATGQLIEKWRLASGLQRDLTDIVVDSVGNVYLVDAQQHQILGLNQAGEVVNSWGARGAGPGQFFKPVAMAIDSQGNFYVVDQGNQRIQKFDPEFNFIQEWGGLGSDHGQFNQPTGIAIDNQDQIYIADTGNHRVQVFQTDGTYLKAVGAWGTDAGQMIQPVDLAFYNGELYVADRGNQRIQVFNLYLNYLYEIGSRGDDWGQFRQINRLHIDGQGNLFVSDRVNRSVQKIGPDHTILQGWHGGEELTTLNLLEQTATVGQTHYYWSVEHQRLLKYDQMLTFLGAVALEGQGEHIYSGFTADANYLYFTDLLNHAVVVYDHSGQMVQTIGQFGQGQGEFDSPLGIAVDGSGYIYVADTGNHRIQKFDQQGQWIQSWGHLGLEAGQLIDPISITYQNDQLFVGDLDLQRVQAFTTWGSYINQWSGIGELPGQLTVLEYLQDDLRDVSQSNVVYRSYDYGLSNDSQVRTWKSWSWTDLWGYGYRYEINTNSSDTPGGDFENIDYASISNVTGKYYLHLQANDIWGSFSTGHFYTILDNDPPTVYMPDSDDTPRQGIELSWSATDNKTSSSDIKYKYLFCSRPPDDWTDLEDFLWYERIFSSTTSAQYSYSNGTKYLVVQAKDELGNRSALYYTSFVMDNEDPEIASYQYSDTTDQRLRVSWSGSDNESYRSDLTYRYVINSSPTSEPTGSFTSTTSVTRNYVIGTLYLHIQVRDEAGNTSETEHLRMDLEDIYPPRITGLSNIINAVKEWLWEWGGQDNISSSDEIEYRYVIDTVTHATLEDYPYDATTSASVDTYGGDGTYYLNIQARDELGNETSVENYSVVIDNTRPTIYPNEINFSGNLVGGTTNVYSPSRAMTIPSAAYYDLNDVELIEYRINSERWEQYGGTTTFNGHGSYQLTVRVTDEAGNSRTAVLPTFKVDREGPVLTSISQEIKDGAWFNSSQSVPISATDNDYSGLKGIQYNLNNSGYVSINNGGSVPVEAEGENLLTIEMEDQAGNIRETDLIVKIDQTDPVISSITSTTHQSDQWSARSAGDFVVEATDDRSGVTAYYYQVTGEETYDLYGNNDYLTSSSETLHLTNLPEGINYLHVAPVDAAGNVGDVVAYKLLTDYDLPLAPVIQSDTHIGGASSYYQKPHFYWETPAAVGQSTVGITHYQYRLEQAINGQIKLVTEGTIEGANELKIQDPLSAGTYYFNLRAVTGAGGLGEEATFTFQVGDLNQATGMQLFSSTHPDPNHFYNIESPTFFWNDAQAPAGTQFAYKFGSAAEFANLAWEPVTEMKKSLHIPNATSGTYQFQVQTGQGTAARTSEIKAIKLDVDPPEVTGFDVQVQPDLRQAIVSWDEASDIGGAGLAEMVMLVQGIDKTDKTVSINRGWIRVAAGSNQQIIENLQPDLKYIVRFEARDRAGNFWLKIAEFTLEPGSPVNIIDKFVQDVDNWGVEWTSLEAIIPDAYVSIDNAYDFKILKGGNYLFTNQVPLTTGELVNDGKDFEGRNDQIEYQIKLADHIFTGQGLYIGGTGEQRGFYLKKIWIDTPEGYWFDRFDREIAENKQILFENVRISGLYATQVQESVTDARTSSSLTANWLYEISEYNLRPETLSFDGQVDLGLTYLNTILNVVGMNLTPELAPESGIISESYELTLPGNNKIRVLESELKADHLLIQKANYRINDSETITLGNFTIDPAGVIEEQADFYSDELKFTEGSVNYTVPANQLRFDDEGQLYITEGTANLTGATTDQLPIATVKLSNQGSVAILSENYFTSIDRTMAGFKVTATNGNPVGNLIYYDAIVELALKDGLGQTITLHLTDLPYGQAGFTLPERTVDKSFNYNQMGTLTMTSIEENLAGTALIISGQLELGSQMPEGMSGRTLELVPFSVASTDQKIADLTAKVLASQPLNLYQALEFSATQIKFTDTSTVQSLVIADGTCKVIGALASQMDLAGVEVNEVEIDSTGELRKLDLDLENNPFFLRSVDVTANSLELDSDYLYLAGDVSLPQLGGAVMAIDSLQLNHRTGGIEAFTLDNPEDLQYNLYDWMLYIDRIEIGDTSFSVKTQIEIPSAVMPFLPLDMTSEFVDINELTIDHSGMIRKLDLTIPYQKTITTKDGLTIIVSDPGIHLENAPQPATNQSLKLSFATSQILIPEVSGGGSITIDNLSLNSKGELGFDQAELVNQKITIGYLGDATISKATLTSENLTMQGKIKLSSIFPGTFAGQEFDFTNLVIDKDGIKSFTVTTVISDPLVINDAIQLTPETITITERQIQLTGGQIQFLGQLKELTTSATIDLDKYTYDYVDKKMIDFDTTLSDLKFALYGYTLDIDTLTFNDEYVSFGGELTLPGGMPGNLGGTSVDISTLEITYQGEIRDYRVAFNNFVSLTTHGLTFSFNYLEIDPEGFTMSATTTLPNYDGIPAPLRGTSITVDNFRINHDLEIVDYSVIIDNDFNFSLGQTDFSITRVTFTKALFTMEGKVKLPEDFPGQLSDRVIDFNRFEVNYQGQVVYSDIRVGDLPNFGLGSFLRADIYDLAFIVDHGDLSLRASKVVTDLGSLEQDIVFSNVIFGMDGQIQADVSATIKLRVAGALIVIEDPQLVNNGIEAKSARLELPDSVGGQGLAVEDLRIDNDHGLQIGSGEFALGLPDMKLGKGKQKAEIKDVYVTLKFASGEYAFEGNGEVNIASIGQFKANIKLRSVTSVYPSGIETIAVSFKSAGLGLPLGSTGLYINGVNGEFADGPIPSGSPYVVQRLGDGMRFNLGVYIRDMSNNLNGYAGLWVSIANLGNASVVGNMYGLKNLVDLDVAASITDHFQDFYAEADIYITPVEGHAGFRIWSANPGTHLAGWADVRVTVPRGKVLYEKWKIAWKTFVVAIPSHEWKSPTVGVEFGEFRNGSRGVKGYMDVPLVGKVGFYAGNNGFTIGGVQKYVLIGRPTALFKPLNFDPTTMNLTSVLQNQELGNYYVGETEYVGFVLPGQKKQTVNENFIMTAEPAALRNYYVPSTQRLIFVVGYDLGDPDVVAIGPDGRRFTADTPGVQYEKEANQVTISIPNPDPGTWYLELEEIRGINYQVAILGSTPEPELVFEKPTLNANDQWVIRGRGGVFTGSECFVDLYYDTDGENADGILIAERIPMTDYMFSYEWDPANLPTGEYQIYGKLYDESDMPPIVSYANGVISHTNYQPITPPTDVTAVEVEDGIKVKWQGDANPNIAGYNIYYGYASGEYVSSLDVGYLTEGKIPTLEEVDDYYMTVVSYNSEFEESNYSTEVAVSTAAAANTVFNLADVAVPESVQLYIGEGKVIEMPYTANGLASNTDGDYFVVEFEHLPDGISISTDQPFYNLYAEKQAITLRVLSEEEDITAPNEPEVILLSEAQPGEQVAKMVLTSVGNPELRVEKELTLNLEYSQPQLREVAPTEGINNQDRELLLSGEEFREGAQVFLGSTAIDVISVEKHEIRATVPYGFAAGQYDLKVVNDDGQEALLTAAYTVKQPEFTLEQLQDQVVVPLGAESEVYLKVQGWNEFTGQVTVQAGVVPEGIWVDKKVEMVGPGEDVSFLIGAGYGLIPGEYQMTFTGMSGDLLKTVEVTIQVVDEQIVPTVQGFDRPFALTTESIRIYGMGFGLNGNLYLNGQLIPVTEWRTNRIDFVVPEDATTGMLVVEAGGQQSEPVELIVREKKYSVSLNPSTLMINHGNEGDIRFVISGFSDPINFTLENVPAGISYQFLTPTQQIVPNYTLECTFNVMKGMKTGEYQLELVGQVGSKVERVPFTIVVTDLPRMQNTAFAEGRVGVAYRDWIDVEGGVAPFQYQIMNNSLPTGLKMTKDGVIFGVPEIAGHHDVKIKVIDSMSQIEEREIELNILSNEWIYSEYDAENSNRSLTDGPAANDTGFEMSITGQPKLMLSGEEVIILIEDQLVTTLDKATGETISTFTSTSSIVDAVVTKAGLIVVDEFGTMSLYSFNTAGTNAEDPKVEVKTLSTLKPVDSLEPVKPGEVKTGEVSKGHLFLYRDRVMVIRDQLLEIRFKNDLILDQSINLVHPYNQSVKGVLKGQVIYYVTGQQQVVGFDLETQKVVTNAEFASQITDLIGIATGVLVVQQDGQVQVLNNAGQAEFVLKHSQEIRHLIPYQAGYLVGDATGLSEYGFHGKLINDLALGYQKALVAGERIYVTTATGIEAYKLSDLTQVWNYQASNSQQILLSQAELYVATDQMLYKFDAPTNVYAPVTESKMMPEVANGDAGYFKQNVTMYLTSTDRDNEVLVTYYSVDGSEFTTYENGILLEEGEHNVQYYAMDEALKSEVVQAEWIKVDYHAPILDLQADPIDGANGYYTTPTVNVAIEATDAISGVDVVYYQIDNEIEQIYTEPFTVAGDGSHLVTYHGRDVAGNETILMKQEIRIDTTVPVLELTTEPVDGQNGYYVHTPVLIELTGVDNFAGMDQIYYQIDGQGYQPYTDQIQLTAEGAHLVEYYGVDQAGNTTDVFTHQLKIDSIAPEISLTVDEIDGENGYYFQEPVHIWLTVTDQESGVAGLYYRIDGGEYLNYEGTLNVTGEGVHVVEYYGVDQAGNQTELMNHEVKIDHTAPELTFTPAPIDGQNGYYVSAPVVHTLTGTDNVSGVAGLYYQIDDNEYELYVDGIRVSGDGAHVVNYYGVDKSGNRTEVFSHSFQIDTTAPELTFTPAPIDGQNGYYVSEPVVHTLTGTDNVSGLAGIYYQVDDSEYELYVDGIQVSGDGAHVVNYFAVDESGNQTEVFSHSFQIDTTVPELTFTPAPIDGQNGYYVSEPVVHTLTGTDNVSGLAGIYYQVDDSEYELYVDGIQVSGDGAHVVNYFAIDESGNQTEVFSHSFQIDTTVPELTFTPAPIDGQNGYYVSAPVVHTLTGTDNVSDVAGLYYQIDDSEYELYVDGIRVSGDGAHVVKYYGVDQSGNQTEVFSHSFQIDTTAPVTTVTRAKSLMNGLKANIRFVATDNYSGFKTIHYQIDGGAMDTTQDEIYLTTPGEHIITYYAEDQAGNLEPAKEVRHLVKSVDEINLVEDVQLTRFHNALTSEQPMEIDRNVQVGDLIYLDEAYLFETLPEYLQGTRLLRTNRHANKTGEAEYYLTFNTTVPVNIYVVVEGTVTQLPGFTYLGQTKFASTKHFSSNQNVFTKEVSGTSTVQIPGSQLVDVGHAPLIFVEFDETMSQPYVDIEKMHPVQEGGTWYLDLAGYGYDQTVGMLEGTDLSWSYVMDGVETQITTGDTATLPIRFRDQAYQLEVRLTATNGDRTGSAAKAQLIVDQSGVYIVQPQNQDKYLPGEEVTLSGQLLDEMGGLMSTPLSWQIQREGQEWQSIGMGNLMQYTLPTEQGAYYVKASVGTTEMIVKFEITQTNKNPGQSPIADPIDDNTDNNGGDNGNGNGNDNGKSKNKDKK